MDGSDTYFVQPLDNLLNIVRSKKFFSYDIIFSSDRDCLLGYERSPEFKVDNETTYPFINSGGIIAKANSLKVALREAPINHHDDQVWWMNVYADWKSKKNLRLPPMAIDTESEIFFTVHHARHHLRLTNENLWKNEVTGTYPVVLHYNYNTKLFRRNDFLTWFESSPKDSLPVPRSSIIKSNLGNFYLGAFPNENSTEVIPVERQNAGIYDISKYYDLKSNSFGYSIQNEWSLKYLSFQNKSKLLYTPGMDLEYQIDILNSIFHLEGDKNGLFRIRHEDKYLVVEQDSVKISYSLTFKNFKECEDCKESLFEFIEAKFVSQRLPEENSCVRKGFIEKARREAEQKG